MVKYIPILIFSFLISSCNFNNESHLEQLKALDNIIEDYPTRVLDSLKTIETEKLSKRERAYYHLLFACATDKNYTYMRSDSTLQIAAVYFSDNKDYYNLSRTQYYLAKYLNYIKDPEGAFHALKDAETNFERSNSKDTHIAGQIYYWLGTIQEKQLNYPEAQSYYEKSLNIFSQNNDTLSIVHSLKQLAQIHINQKDYQIAEKLLDQSLEFINSISNQSSKRVIEIKVIILNTQNYYYRKIEDHKNALAIGKQCIATLKKANQNINSGYYWGLVTSYIKCDQPDSAKYYGQQMIEAAQQENNLFNQINSYKLLFKLEEDQGNYKEACALRDKYNELKDEYDKSSKSKALVELEKKYNLAEKEKEVLQIKNKNLWLYLTVLIIAFSASIILLYYSWIHRRLKEKYRELSEKVNKTKWGFAISKALIADNHSAYEELERLLNRHKINLENPKLYDEFQNLAKSQKTDYSSRLFSTLVNIDPNFIKQFQELAPDLTSEEVMLAAMLRHEWSMKDISEVFRLSVDATRKRRNRLETKIRIKINSEQSLEEILKQM